LASFSLGRALFKFGEAKTISAARALISRSLYRDRVINLVFRDTVS